MTRQTSFHLFFISVLLFLSLVVAAQTESSKLPLVRVKGNQFIAGNDKPLVFKALMPAIPTSWSATATGTKHILKR
jgi:hypothetical protein